MRSKIAPAVKSRNQQFALDFPGVGQSAIGNHHQAI
jgi:hypothetical protein